MLPRRELVRIETYLATLMAPLLSAVFFPDIGGSGADTGWSSGAGGEPGHLAMYDGRGGAATTGTVGFAPVTSKTYNNRGIPLHLTCYLFSLFY